MKWTYSIHQKTTAAVLFAAIFAVIFIVNRIENNKVNELGISMNSVYQDRLMVENYIFQLSALLYEKKILLDQCTGSSYNEDQQLYLNNQNQAIAHLILNYENTELTELEATLFSDLKKQVEQIKEQEQLYLQSKSNSSDVENIALAESFKSANYLLSDLSNVQIKVGKTVNERSQQLVAGSTLLTSFEMAVLIVIGLLIHALLFASKSVMKKVIGQPNLN